MARKSKAKDIDKVATAVASVEPTTPRKIERNPDPSTTRRSIRRPRKAREEVIGDISESYRRLPSTAIGQKRKRSTVEPYGAESQISVVDLEEPEIQFKQETPRRTANVTIVEAIGQISTIENTPKKSRKGKKEDLSSGESPKKARRRRKTKEEKEAEAMPLAVRTKGLKMFIGAHVSCAKGVQNAVTNAVHIGGNSFALFLKSQRKWENPPLQDDHKLMFHANCAEHSYDAAAHIVPHGSYLVNLAQEDPDKAKQAYGAFIDDLHRCEALGIKLYNFHPGNTGPSPRPAAISRISDAINRAHKETRAVKPVLENMAGSGNVIGSTFEDLRDIIEQVDDKTRIGVCIDTCHAFASGYDLRTAEALRTTLQNFDSVIGMRYLSALHLNDSKAPFSSHRDLHQNIGLGFLGLRAFHSVMNEPRFEGLPIVLETPIDRKSADGKDVEDKSIWATEIKLLESLIGMDPECQDFKTMEKDLAAKGAEERQKLQDAYDRKQEKDRKAAEKGKGNRRVRNHKKGEETEDSGSDA